jgi:hypothetical protein
MTGLAAVAAAVFSDHNDRRHDDDGWRCCGICSADDAERGTAKESNNQGIQ